MTSKKNSQIKPTSEFIISTKFIDGIDNIQNILNKYPNKNHVELYHVEL